MTDKSRTPTPPDGVPSTATYDERSNTWQDAHVVNGGEKRSVWDEGGERLYEEFRHADTGKRRSMFVDFDNAIAHLDFDDRRGELRRFDADESVRGFLPGADRSFPRFPENPAIYEIKFTFRDADSEAITFDVHELAYLNRFGETVDAAGDRTEPPGWLVPPTPKLDDGVYSSARADGSTRFRLVVKEGTVVEETEYDETGEMLMEHRRREGEDVFVLRGPQGVLRFERTEAMLRFEVRQGDQRVAGVERAETELSSAEDFVEAFDAFYGPLVEHFDLSGNRYRLCVHGFSLDHSEIDRNETGFRVATLFGNGGGDNLIVIEEPGELEGRVFSNYHDEGLYHIESIDEFIEEEGLEDEAPVDLVKLMPFYPNAMGNSLTELWREIAIRPWDDPQRDLGALKREA